MDNPAFPKILAVQAVIVDEEDNVLLVQRTKDPNNGKWEVVAGYVDPGERLKEAVIRHIKKDTGLTELKKIEFTGNYYDEPSRHPGTYCIPFVFKVIVDKNIKPEKGSWFDPEELKTLDIAFDNKKSLEDLNLIP